ncbi:PAS/PAC sensor hybrid histidine kinase [Dehalogenimonas lykanthroporepellens BL-DC-9]|nr:PAS/PAC sensor hybrid histidine kinase [Dehalogenimonas lykanthroporepellens BL-DC-9]
MNRKSEEAEARFQQLEERYKQLFQQHPSGYHSLDAGGNIIEVNQAWLDSLGYTRDEVIGHWFGEFLNPESAEKFRLTFPRFKEKGIVGTEFCFKRKDGSLRVEVVDGRIAYDIDGNFQQTHCVLQDVTEARQAETAMQQSRQKYQALFESSGDAAFVHQPTPEGLPGVFLEVNQTACELLGYTKDEFLKLGPRDIVVWEKFGVTPPDIMKILEAVKKVTRESAFRHKDGHEIPVEVVIHRFELQGKPAVLTLARDITKRKKAEEELKLQADELKNRNLFIQTIIDQLPIGLAINNTGDGQVTYMNSRFEEIYGWPKEEITDIATFFEKVYPDAGYREAIVSRIMADIESSDPARMHWEDIEITRKDGGKRVVAAANIPIPDQGVMVSTVRDETEAVSARRELNHTLNLMRYIIEHDQAGIAVHDRNLNYIYVSQRYLDEYNLGPRNIIGRHHYDVFPDLPQKWRDVHQRALAGEICRADRDEFVREDGTVEWTRWECRPWFEKDGSVGGIIVYTEVITEQINRERALAESKEKYRQLAENTESISWEYDIEQDRWTYLASQVGRILGYRPEEFTDLQFWADHIHPEDRDWAPKYCLTAARAGRDHSLEYRFLKKDGKSVWLRNIVSVEQAGCQPVKLRGIMIDITERKQAEEEALRSAAEWLATFDSITDMVALVDTGHRITRVNQAFARVLGRKPGELLGKRCYEVIHGLKGPHPDCPYARALTTRQVETSEYFDEKLGLWVEATASPIMDVDGNMVGSVHIIKDVSGRKRAEENERLLREKAEMSSRLAAVGEMAAGIAHEINNPLTGVIGFSELLMTRPDVPDDMKEDLHIINEGSQRVKDIVRRMLTFARQSKPVKSAVNIIDVLENTIEMRRYVLETSNISIVRDYARDITEVVADAGQLQQVFLNIIVNAEYAMKKAHDKGVLVVKTEKSDGHIRVLITDDGPGMSDEVKSKLFQPFFTTKDPGEGTGLGLALSMGIIKEHGGSISVKTVVGKGTTFIVELPMTPVETVSAVENQETQPVKAIRSAKILVVDDERSVGALIRVILTRQGHEVQECYGPQEALDKLVDNTYDIVILDIRMPGMSGIELLDEIKVRWPKMVSRVLFITGDTSDLSTRTYLNTHNIPYISKPFERHELEEKVNALL